MRWDIKITDNSSSSSSSSFWTLLLQRICCCRDTIIISTMVTQALWRRKAVRQPQPNGHTELAKRLRVMDLVSIGL